MADAGSPTAAADVPITDAVTDDIPAAAVVEESASPAKQSVEAAANGTSQDAPAEQEDEAPKAAGKGKNRKNKKGAAAKTAAAAAAAADAEELADAAAEDTAAAASKSGDLGDASTQADAAAVAKSSNAAAPAAADSSSAPADTDSKASPAAAAPATPATTGSVSRSNSSSGAAAAAAEQPQRASSAGGKPPTPKAEAAPAAAAAASGSGSLDDLSDAPKVKALREQLSQVRSHLSVEQSVRQNGNVALTGGVAQPPPPEPKPEAGLTRRLSEHDRVNNTNALELLQTGSFKLVPGKDTVPYEKLMGLRLEDGIDVTRKEEYLAGDEFATVFKMEREAFLKLPQWKRLQLKKSTLLF